MKDVSVKANKTEGEDNESLSKELIEEEAGRKREAERL